MVQVSSLKGFTFIELIATLGILSILATLTLPFLKLEFKRNKESDLRRELRIARDAIDRFNRDCEAGLITKGQDGVSNDCYPEELSYLVEGVDESDASGGMRFYLRRLPFDPFTKSNDEWEIRGYRDEPEGTWFGEDVYDIRVGYDGVALDGSEYRDW
jgi:general secretion pathway protein G